MYFVSCLFCQNAPCGSVAVLLFFCGERPKNIVVRYEQESMKIRMSTRATVLGGGKFKSQQLPSHVFVCSVDVENEIVNIEIAFFCGILN